MAQHRILPGPRRDRDTTVKAVLGPTNTGKTHLAIERLIAHSSGAIGFPLRLLAREVYDRVVAIKGPNEVALITGEERIEPKGARWLLCTAEAMPARPDLAFVALDEAQIAADRERGHIFTDRLLHARGREETMLLGSATIEPLVRSLVPEAEIVSRPRFSTLSHIEPRKLSRIPPRSAIVAFSADQVYAVAEMLRRFRGGAAVVMGALSPQTRNAQVQLFQSGEVDYLVATDAIGMGLNLDVGHVAFAGLSKFDGVRQRRLTPAEMAQIAGRAGRHQRDGTFGALAGAGARTDGRDAEFTAEEVFAIEEHRFAPLTRLFWRQPDPRGATLAGLIADLETPPPRPELAPAPEAVDLAVLRRLADDPAIAAGVRGERQVNRFWQVCSLPDFRQHGAETHARFVARLWDDLAHGQLSLDTVAGAIAQLDNVQGDIDALQGRIAAIRSWAYIAQRPDWVIAREEMAARARAAETRLSDALHARLTERFVNRRTSVLMRRTGPDAGLLAVELAGDTVLVEGEAIGTLAGFRFKVDPATRHADRKLLLAAAERHVPELLAKRAGDLAKAIADGSAAIAIADGAITWDGIAIAALDRRKGAGRPQLIVDPALRALGAAANPLLGAMEDWLAARLKPLAPLDALLAAARDPAAGADLRALLIALADAGGVLARAGSGLDRIDDGQRQRLRRLGVTIGALDLFVPALLKPAALAALALVGHGNGLAARPVVPLRDAPFTHRKLGKQALRVDLAERLLRAAHEARVKAQARPPRDVVLDPAPAVSMGLTTASYARLLAQAGFQARVFRPLADGAHGPPAPPRWRWRPPRRAPAESAPRTAPGGAFAALADLIA
ncbi:helicase-related protein [Parablastomonas sp. CN1-191]|uniref:helicase-related protein n=1 Tax=Parablastomonas sp. CN1-191 TaxID=3400908 RepID=UPI003BF7CDD1